MAFLTSLPDDELPRVSALIPTYNFESYIGRAIDSVLDQGYPPDKLQVVVVDDGSTDATPAAVEPYLDRVTYIRKPNGGLLSSVNRLFDEADGDLLALQSGDDVWLPGRLALQVGRFLDRPEVGLVYGDMRVIDADERLLHDSYWQLHQITPLRGRVLPRLMCGNVVSGGTVMVRADLVPRFHPIPPYAAWEDWWMAMRVAEVAEIDYIEAPLLGYRQHGRNMNLGLQGEQELRRYEIELPLRRWIVTDLECPDASTADWLETYQHWHGIIRMVAEGTGRAPADLVPVDEPGARDAVAAAHRTGERLAEGDLTGAVREAIRALGHQPFLPESIAAMARVQEATSDPGDATFVTLADAGELIATPDLLRAYGATFDGSARASLTVILSEEQVPALSALVDDCGLAGKEAALIVGEVSAESFVAAARPLAGHVHAVLSERPPIEGFGLHPHAGSADVGRLRALAERRWARLA